MRSTLVIGSRGSGLALAQTQLIAERLRAAAPDVEVRIEVISTKGDRIVDRPLIAVGGKGLFTKEIETALIEHRIDLAVHSMKDLPTELPEGLVLGAVPPRENPRDALISASGAGLADLPPGARIGTSSLRRRAQLIARRPDLDLVDLRGNVDTRLRRVTEGMVDATILACAGLARLGFADAVTEVLAPDVMVPAPAQGALALEIRDDDTWLRDLLRKIADPRAEAEVTAERVLLAALGGGCHVPIGALARADGDRMTLTACVCAPDGSRILRVAMTGAAADPAGLGRRAAAALEADGALQLIADAPAPVEASERGALDGIKVVVTRAASQAGELVAQLRERGAEVLAFPTIEVRPTDTPPPFAAEETFDWLLLTSANAVHAFYNRLAAAGRDPSAVAVKIAAIGPATARAIADHGLTVSLMPGEHVAEALFDALTLEEPDLGGRRLLLPCSDLARSYLSDALRERGAHVTEWVLYCTVAPEVPPGRLAALLEFAPHAVVFTSPSTVHNFYEILGPDRMAALARTTKFAAIGPITCAEAEALGLTVAVQPARHDVPGLVDALVAAAAHLL